jgi:Flp pilus assembly protein TadD/predicted  nucleic acid-binding Zn-ribbon protein
MIHRVSSLLRLPPLLALALIGLIPVPVAVSQTPAQQMTTFDPSDVYFQGYLSVRDAEKFEQTSDFVEADDKLERARKMFSSIQTYFPDWKAEMVKGRMEKTEEAIARVKPKANEIRQKSRNAVAELEGGVKANGRVLPPGQGVRPLNPGMPAAPISPTRSLDTLESQRLFKAETEVKRLEKMIQDSKLSETEASRNASRVTDLQAQRDLLQSQLKSAQTDLAAMRATLAAAPVQSELNSLNSKIEALQQEREAMGTALNQSRSQQLEAMSKIATLQADVKALQQNKADLERDLKLQNATAVEVVAGLRAQMKDLEATLSKRDSELTAANSRITGLMKELDESRAAYSQLQTEHSELLQEQVQMKALLKLNEAGRIQELIEQNVDLAKKFREANEKVDRLNADGNATKDLLTEAVRDLGIAKSQINKLQREKREQDQRVADLEKRLKDEEAGLANGGGDPAEANMLREIIKKQLLVQERRRQAKDELVKAIQQLGSKDETVQQAIKQLDGQDLELSQEEQKLIAGNADADLISPYARDRKTVEGATSGLTREIEGYDMAAKKAFSAGRLLPARELYELSVEANPGDSSSICKLGVVLGRLEEWPAASDAFRRATEINANNPYAHRMLGLALMKLNDLPGAEQSLRHAVEVAPDDAAGHLLLGSVYFRLGRLQESESAYRAAIASDPVLSEPYFNLAVLCARSNRQQEGLKLYQQALELGGLPDHSLEAKLIAVPKEKAPAKPSGTPERSQPRPANPPAAKKAAP